MGTLACENRKGAGTQDEMVSEPLLSAGLLVYIGSK